MATSLGLETTMTTTTTKKNKDVVRLVVLSDTHGKHDELTHLLPPGDLLLHCGDFANRGSLEDAKNFVQWVSSLHQYPQKLVIDGNHDRTLDDKDTKKSNDPMEIDDPNIDLMQVFAKADPSVRLLQDETFTTKHGLVVHGSSWKSCEEDSFGPLTSGVDVWMFHLHPKLYFAPEDVRSDSVVVIPEDPHYSFARGWHGSRTIAKSAKRYKIPLNLSGHVHMSRGMLKLKDGSSVFINASSSWSNREGAKGITAPIVIDFDLRTRQVVGVNLEPHPSSW
jgi:predicted phosphodiesterase